MKQSMYISSLQFMVGMNKSVCLKAWWSNRVQRCTNQGNSLQLICSLLILEAGSRLESFGLDGKSGRTILKIGPRSVGRFDPALCS